MRLESNIKQNRTVATVLGACLALALLLAVPGVAVAADYYVDINSGSDTNDGLSAVTAWKTLHYTAGQLVEQTGHTIHVAPGLYNLTNEGGALAADLPLQFSSSVVGDPAGGTIIDASGGDGWANGLDVTGDAHVSDLEIRGAWQYGINVSSGTGNTITRCDVHDNSSAGISLSDCDATNTVSANKIYDNSTGIYIYAYADGSPTVVNNLIYSTGTSMEKGINFYVEAYSGTFSPSIYHNTIDSAYMAGIEIYDSYNNSAALTPRIQYNIITNSGTGIVDSSTPAENPIIDYNNLFGNTADYSNAASGANDLFADPLYNDPAGYDFHLTAGSPCVDAAVTSGISVDLDGTARPQATYPDIGCYEMMASDETVALPPVEPGTTAADYRMVSVTHIPQDPSASAVLGDDMSGGYDPTQYRIGIYDCEYNGGAYREYPNFTVHPGGAVWILARNGMEADITGVPVKTDVSVEAPLRYNTANGNGWNMVGPPNARDYLWSDVQIAVYDPQTGEVVFSSRISDLTADNPYIDIRLWEWADGAYAPDTTLMEAGCGYWVRAKQANVNLVFPALFDGQALVDGLTPRMWLALGADRIKKAAAKIFSPASAIAADDDETPPQPMGGLDVSLDNEDSSVDFSCFISTLMGE